MATSRTIVYKQSSEKIKSGMDFSNWIDDEITLSSPSVSFDPDDGTVTVSEVEISGQQVQFFIAGGTNGKTYRFDVSVLTSGGETLIGDGLLKVRNR